MMDITLKFKNQLIQYFAVFPKDEILYMTQNGVIFRQHDLENVIDFMGGDELIMVSRAAIKLSFIEKPILAEHRFKLIRH